MKRHLLLALSLFAASTLGFAIPDLHAAEATVADENKAEKVEVADKTGKPYPFTGKVTKVDAGAMTFSLNGAKGKDRVFMVNEATKISKNGKPATLADLMEGEDVGGRVSKQGDNLLATSLRIGGKGKAEAAEAMKPVTTETSGEAKPTATPAAKAKTTPAKKK